ncbi:MAG: hypothetical protein AAB552_02590 [Patescibacteria group bacterium]
MSTKEVVANTGDSEIILVIVLFFVFGIILTLVIEYLRQQKESQQRYEREKYLADAKKRIASATTFDELHKLLGTEDQEFKFSIIIEMRSMATTFDELSIVYDCNPCDYVLTKMLQLASTFYKAEIVYNLAEDGSQLKSLAWAKMKRLI